VNNGCKNTDRWTEILTQTSQAPEQTQRNWPVGCTVHAAWSAAAAMRAAARIVQARATALALSPISECAPSSRWIRRKLCRRAAHHQRCRHWSHWAHCGQWRDPYRSAPCWAQTRAHPVLEWTYLGTFVRFVTHKCTQHGLRLRKGRILTFAAGARLQLWYGACSGFLFV